MIIWREGLGLQYFVSILNHLLQLILKCRDLTAEMESILKQFKIYCEDEKLDEEAAHGKRT